MEEQLCFSGSLLSVNELVVMPMCAPLNVVFYLDSGGSVVQVEKSGVSLVPKAINIVGGVDTNVKVAARKFIAQSKLSFAQAMSNNAYFTVTNLPQPCMKGDSISIKIPRELYNAKISSNGRLILKKGEKPSTAKQLQETLVPLWKINNRKLVTLDIGFFEFIF